MLFFIIMLSAYWYVYLYDNAFARKSIYTFTDEKEKIYAYIVANWAESVTKYIVWETSDISTLNNESLADGFIHSRSVSVLSCARSF